MKKIYALEQGSDLLRDMAFLLIASAAVLLSGCETAPHRTELAMAPPVFIPAAENVAIYTEVYTVLRAPAVTTIEPAAGTADTADCLQVGSKDEDALFYQWGDNRLGVDVASYSGGDRFEDYGEARMRYSISLQKNRTAPGCSENSALRFGN